eukprot:14964805-Alexandrium_andersonii.AAC.1
MALSAARTLQKSEPRHNADLCAGGACEACEARRLRRPPLDNGAPTRFVDSEPQRRLFGPLGELGPRPSTED